MVTACQTCGAIGFRNALIICETCRIATQHRYCSEKLTFTEDVTWFCDDCLPPSKPIVPLRKSERVKKMKDEVKKRKAQAIKSKTSVNGNLNSQERQVSPPLCSENGMVLEQTEHAHIADIADNASNVPMHGEKNSMPCENQREAEQDLLPQQLVQENKCTSAEEPDTTQSKGSQLTDAPEVILDDSSHTPAVPILCPVWRGQFKIFNKTKGSKSFRLVGGLGVHLSSNACYKVTKEASLLPSVLVLEMRFKSDVWPKSFQKSEPTDDHIGVYIFPGNPIDEKVYDCLVEDMVTEELGMTALVANAELLIFTSTVLPLKYWRFKGKHYLWGVFRAKRQSASCPSASKSSASKSSASYPSFSDWLERGDRSRLSHSSDGG